MDVNCKRCGAAIPAEDVNISALMAKCGQCDAVFSIADAGGVMARNRPQAEMPKNITVQERNHVLTIRRRWYSWAAWFLVFFCLIWDGFVGVFAFGAILGGDAPVFLLFFMLPFVAVGAGMSYFTLCMFLNTTEIRVDRQHLQVTHMPLPWPGKLKLAADMVEQLHCQRKVTHSSKGGSSVTYEVHANSKHGKTRKLLGSLHTADEALFLEQEIERFLGITDRPVAGEYTGTD